MTRFIQIILLISISVFFSCNTQDVKETDKPYVVILSMDAFRWDYPDRYPTPNLDAIAKNGVKAHSIIPCFPTKTFPNHYSMATGLYPDHHGIVMNNFYDPQMDAIYKIGKTEAVNKADFYSGEPIWETAENQGVKSASFFWVGSEAPFNTDQHPYIYKAYDEDLPFENRIDSVITWLSLPEEKRPHLILWYWHEPDEVGHNFGPYSAETRKCVIRLDSLVGVFMNKIDALPHKDQINLIFTSDHGMGPTYKDQQVVLSDYLKENWIDGAYGGNPAWTLNVKEGYIDEVSDALSTIEHTRAWKSEDIPERLHYGTNPRTLDFVVVADSAWTLHWKKRKYTSDGGTHGYDNMNTDMHAIFYARGPAFKTNYQHPSFNNIDLYSLISTIMHLEPARNDGNFDHVKGLLK